MKGTCNSNPTSVCERSDNQTSCSSHILITILQAGLNLVDIDDTVAPFAVTVLSLVVVSELLLPIKVVDRGDFVCFKFLNNVSCVHIGRNQGDNDASLQIFQV